MAARWHSIDRLIYSTNAIYSSWKNRHRSCSINRTLLIQIAICLYSVRQMHWMTWHTVPPTYRPLPATPRNNLWWLCEEQNIEKSWAKWTRPHSDADKGNWNLATATHFTLISCAASPTPWPTYSRIWRPIWWSQTRSIWQLISHWTWLSIRPHCLKVLPSTIQ